MRAKWRSALEREVRAALERESSGHDVHHALRVRDLAVHLAEVLGADGDAVEAMALLHDIGHVDGRDDHASNGARAAAEVLRRIGFPDEKVGLVAACIEHHHWTPDNSGDLEDPPLEYQVFADADRLDALGAIGIARAFAFGGAHGRPIWDPHEDESPESMCGPSTVHHFYAKLLRLEAGMYTTPARRLAARRTEILKDFLDTFFDEWSQRDLVSGSGSTTRQTSDRREGKRSIRCSRG